MENITKKILRMKCLIELTVAFKVSLSRIRFKRRVPDLDEPAYVEMIENDCMDIEGIELDKLKVDFEEQERKRMLEDIKKGQEGVRLLFKNPRFLMALIGKRSDILTLIIEQYYIEGKITDYTIDALLTSGNIKFTEEERNKLGSFVNVLTDFGTFGLV